MSEQLIAIDWGTSNFRAQLLDSAGGEVCDSVCSDRGVGGLDREAMRLQLLQLCERWPSANGKLFACGMVGSDLGWMEAPYLNCTAGIADIAAAVIEAPVAHYTLRIVPGLRCHSADNGWDVMRGEELQALGWAALQGERPASGLCVMPGTHSKWVRLHNGRVERFSTAMSGEIFALLCQHGLLRHHITRDANYSQAFRAGLEKGRQQTGLARHLFSVRANSLHEELDRADASSFVSGLLIGAEIADALNTHQWSAERGPVHLIGTSALIRLYSEALAHFNIETSRTEGQRAAMAGFLALHRHREVTHVA